MLIAWIIQNNSFAINLWVKKDVCLHLVSSTKMKDKVLLLLPFHGNFAGGHSKKQDADGIRGNLNVYQYDYNL